MKNAWEDVSINPSTPNGQMDTQITYNEEKEHWKWKNSHKIGVTSQLDGWKVAICVLSVLLSMGLTIQTHAKIAPKCLISAWMVSLVAFIGLDPLNAVRCILASITRVMVSFSLVALIINLWYLNRNYIIVSIILSLFCFGLCIKFNSLWLRSENWLYTDAVQHAIAADPENESGRAWQGWGKRSCRTLYGQCGYPIDDQVVDAYAKPVFYLVYTSIKNRYAANEKELEKFKEEAYKFESDLKQMEHENEGLRMDLASKKLDKEDDHRIYESLRDEVESLRKQVVELTLANEELVKDLPEPVELKPDDRYLYMNVEDRVKELLLREKSCREIAEITGMSKSAVAVRKKKMEEEIDD